MLRLCPEAPGRDIGVTVRPEREIAIVDRDGSGKSPPGESSSFDLAKMTEADVAAEIAQRMARWRRTNTRPAATERGPPPGSTAGPPAAPPPRQTAAPP